MVITRDLLLKYLADNFALDVQEINDTTELFSGGLLDSFSVAELLIFLEETGNFIVEPDEVVLENIDSVSNILIFAMRKVEEVACSVDSDEIEIS